MTADRSQTVGVVVLNWNGRAHTLACLDSLASSDWPAICTIVVDNSSEEDLEPDLSTRFPTATLIRNDENLGFAGGMNVGLRRALASGADYVLLLNNDTKTERSMVRRLVQAAAARPEAGIVSPLVISDGSEPTVLSAGWQFDPRRGHPGRPLLAGTFVAYAPAGVREVAASSGEAMLVARDALREVGELDESYYLRLEDIDWSLRMRAHGRRNYVVLDAWLIHAVSVSSGGEHSPLNAYYHTRNILIATTRHAPLGRGRAILREVEVLVANLAHSRRGDRPSHNARAVLAGWLDYRRGRRGRWRDA